LADSQATTNGKIADGEMFFLPNQGKVTMTYSRLPKKHSQEKCLRLFVNKVRFFIVLYTFYLTITHVCQAKALKNIFFVQKHCDV